MTLEEIEIRKNYGIKDEDILNIPAAPLWELCQQFKEALPGQSERADAFYGFYCMRIKEIAKEKVEVRATLNAKIEKERREFNKEEAIASFKPFHK